jgi:hypothetical protein
MSMMTNWRLSNQMLVFNFVENLYFVMFWKGIKTIENLDLHFRLGNEHLYQLKINEKNSHIFCVVFQKFN